MIYEAYRRILGLDSTYTLDDLKSAYHRQAKKNHPDLFPEQRRHRQELAMMRINEAYMSLAAARMDGAPRPAEGAGTRDDATSREYASREERSSVREGTPAESGPQPDEKAIGQLKDPAYAYYKLGFVYYSKGYSELYRKDPRIIREQLKRLKTYDYYILRLTIRALQHFERSYRYFCTVVDQYPQSMWAVDARMKLGRIQKYNTIYQRICDNLSRSIRHARKEAAAADPATAVSTPSGSAQL